MIPVARRNSAISLHSKLRDRAGGPWIFFARMSRDTCRFLQPATMPLPGCSSPDVVDSLALMATQPVLKLIIVEIAVAFNAELYSFVWMIAERHLLIEANEEHIVARNMEASAQRRKASAKD